MKARNRDEIAEVGIGKDGCLYVRPRKEKFPFIYRVSMEIKWDESEHVLWAPKRGEWSYVQWFGQILGAAKSEYGITLEIPDGVKWINIPEEVQKEMIEIANNL